MSKFWSRGNPQLYELNTLAWLFELSRKLGARLTLGQVPPEEWRSLKELGMDFVWLMGIWKRSPAGRRISLSLPELHRLYEAALPGWREEDVIGSSYSISAYEPDPMVGTWEDIDAARAQLHKLGIGLILDFIPNHTGIDFPWVFEHPEYYVQGREEDYRNNQSAFLRIRHRGRTLYLANGKDPYFPAWTDTVQLNYFNPEARTAIIGELEKVAKHCDGVRCDMAMLVLNDIFARTWGWAKQNASEMPPREFWSEAMKHAPDLVWMAEAYWNTELALLQLGFDYVYDKRLYDRLRWESAHEVYAHLKADAASQAKMVRFLENHDEARSAAVFERGKLMAASVLVATLPGMRLYFHGQLEGRKVRLPLQLRRAKDEPSDSELHAFYKKLLSIANQAVFHEGVWQLKEVLPAWDNTSRNLVACSWRSGNQVKIIVVNLSRERSQCRLPLGEELRPDGSYTLLDEMNGQKYKRSGKEMDSPGLHVILDGYRSHVFEVAIE